MNRYSIEILRTINKQTKKTRYFKQVCDQMIRISKKEYSDIRDQCDGIYNLFTTSNNKHIKHFTGCTFYISE